MNANVTTRAATNLRELLLGSGVLNHMDRERDKEHSLAKLARCRELAREISKRTYCGMI